MYASQIEEDHRHRGGQAARAAAPRDDEDRRRRQQRERRELVAHDHHGEEEQHDPDQRGPHRWPGARARPPAGRIHVTRIASTIRYSRYANAWGEK